MGGWGGLKKSFVYYCMMYAIVKGEFKSRHCSDSPPMTAKIRQNDPEQTNRTRTSQLPARKKNMEQNSGLVLIDRRILRIDISPAAKLV